MHRQNRARLELLVRGVANIAKSLAYEGFEGIIETDHWFGPLFTNLRIIKTDTPIEFRCDIPFLQVQPVPKEVYADKFLRNFVVKEMHELTAQNWAQFRRTVVNRTWHRSESAVAMPFRSAEASLCKVVGCRGRAGSRRSAG